MTNDRPSGHRWMTGLSILLFLVFWFGISLLPTMGKIIAGPGAVFAALVDSIRNGFLFPNIAASLYRIIVGFFLGLLLAIPAAFVMGWYEKIRLIVEPWIQFLRTIPPIALIPLVIVLLGVGEEAKVAIIFYSTFLVMVVTIYQGVKGVDYTLIKAARVLGARDRDIFFRVVVPASFPFVLVGTRLGIATALTTLIAAELTGAQKGLGDMIMVASTFFEMDVLLLGIAIIGVLGFALDRVVLYLDKRLTCWQEKRN